MKLLIVTSNMSMGGAQRVTLTLTKWLVDKGIPTTIVTLGKLQQYVVDKELSVISLDQTNSKDIFGAVSKLRKVIRGEKPTVLLTMGVPLCLYTVPALWGFKVHHIVSERNDPRHFLGKKIVAKVSRLLMSTAKGFVFQTKQAQEFYPVSVQKRSVVIPNPVMATNLPEAKGEEKTVVTMGRLTKQKNHKMLIRAFHSFREKYPAYQLKIYGDGEMRDELEAYIADIGEEGSVILCGAHTDVHQKIANADFFVMSSDFEGMPNALMEAMAMGLPCISTDCPCGGPAYLIRDGENGILVPVGDAEKLSSAMELLAQDKALKERVGMNAKTVRETLSSENVCSLWYAYFKSLN